MRTRRAAAASAKPAPRLSGTKANVRTSRAAGVSAPNPEASQVAYPKPYTPPSSVHRCERPIILVSIGVGAAALKARGRRGVGANAVRTGTTPARSRLECAAGCSNIHAHGVHGAEYGGACMKVHF